LNFVIIRKDIIAIIKNSMGIGTSGTAVVPVIVIS
jgi:hypothetical protein